MFKTYILKLRFCTKHIMYYLTLYEQAIQKFYNVHIFSILQIIVFTIIYGATGYCL